MMETKIYCDHCGKELNLWQGFNDIVIDEPNKHFYVDLCNDCVDKLNIIIKEFVSR